MPRRDYCSIRPLLESDLELILKWRNETRIRSISFSDERISPEQHRNWYAGFRQSRNIASIFEYRGEPSGFIKTEKSDWTAGTCEWGFYVGYTGRAVGLGTAMAYLFLEHLFDDRGMRKVTGKILDANEKSVQFHLNLGFEKDGFMEPIARDGQILKVIRASMGYHKWQAVKKRMHRNIFEMQSSGIVENGVFTEIPEVEIAGRRIGPDHPPLLVAEMSANHQGSLEKALAIVDAAAGAGAHALKLQTFTADTMTLNLRRDEFIINDPKSLWFGRSLHELYHEAHLPWDWHQPIFERCRQQGLICFSTPFDESSVDFLESLEVPAFKIASFENTDLPLIRRVARTGKPLIISTGMASLAELDASVTAARDAGCRQMILLKCTSAYPAPASEANLRTLPHLRDLFGVQAGISDHSQGLGVSLAAVALGAVFIERHFTIARSDGGLDAAFSLEPAEFRQLVEESERIWQAQGEVRYGAHGRERDSLVFRRSLYTVCDVKRGDIVSEKNVRAIRPGLGLPPGRFAEVKGYTFRADAPVGTPLSDELLQSPG